jgi:predicted phosphohydrolase
MSDRQGRGGEAARRLVVSPRGMAPLVRKGLAEARASSPPGGLSADEAQAEAALREGMERTLALLDQQQDREEVMFVANHEPTSLLQSFLAEQAEGHRAELAEHGRLTDRPDGCLEVQFAEEDLSGWLRSFFGWWRGLLERHPWIPPVADPYRQLGPVARIALLGDWGTGRYGAPVCAASIQATQIAYDAIVHLGDVYYSGTPAEVEERFLAHWPKVPGAISVALNSNHEMYSGGKGYFETALRSPLFDQPSSAVAIENDHFVIACLDTAYEAGDLAGDQAGWLARLVGRAEQKGQKIVLMSHHPPFSLFEEAADRAVERLRGQLTEGRILAWYWGHEHRAVMYDRHEDWKMFGRCIGHSGFPYFRDDLSKAIDQRTNPDGTTWNLVVKDGLPPAWVLDGPNVYVRGHEERYGPHGYASLILDGPHLHEVVHTAEGEEIWTAQLA